MLAALTFLLLWSPATAARMRTADDSTFDLRAADEVSIACSEVKGAIARNGAWLKHAGCRCPDGKGGDKVNSQVLSDGCGAFKGERVFSIGGIVSSFPKVYDRMSCFCTDPKVVEPLTAVKAAQIDEEIEPKHIDEETGLEWFDAEEPEEIDADAPFTPAVPEKKKELQMTTTKGCASLPMPSGNDQAAGKIDNMDALMNSDKVITYAWGPAFANKKGQTSQVFGWGYNEETKKIQFWYAKHNHILRDKTNTIGWGMSAACAAGPCVDLEYVNKKKTYEPCNQDTCPPDSKVAFAAYGEFVLTQIDGRYRLAKPDKKTCYIDQIFACTTEAATIVYGGDC